MKNLVSPMPGKVFKINVAAGEFVNTNDEVVILESMKMELPITATASGKVAEISVSEGDAVAQGAVLMVLE